MQNPKGTAYVCHPQRRRIMEKADCTSNLMRMWIVLRATREKKRQKGTFEKSIQRKNIFLKTVGRDNAETTPYITHINPAMILLPPVVQKNLQADQTDWS